MRTLKGNRSVALITAIVALVTFLGNNVQSATLGDFRLGISEQRTRLVFQFDQTATYEIDFDATAVTIRFDSLTVPKEIEETFYRSRSQVLGGTSFSSDAGEVIFRLIAKGPFYMRYFDLVKPERLVVDLYLKEQEVVAAQIPVTEEPTTEEIKTTQIEPEEAEGIVEEEIVESPPPVTAEVSRETGIVSTEEESYPKTEAEPVTETPEPAAQLGESRSSPNLWYFVLPVAIIMLFVIGFVALRRASRRTDYSEEEIVEDKSWLYSGSKFAKLVKNEETEETVPIPAGEPDEDVLIDSEEVTPVSDKAEAPTIEESPEIITEVQPSEEVQPEDLEKISEATEQTEDSQVERLDEADNIPESEDSLKEKVVIPQAFEGDDDSKAASPESELKREAVTEQALKEAPGSTSLAELEEEEEKPGLEPVRRPMHEVLDEGSAELNFEEGSLIWPVHIIESDRPGRVMVVDDEEEIVSVLEQFLQQEKYEVLGITDSKEAVEKCQTWRPDLLITDVVMPELSGVELVRGFRDRNDLIGKVIFLSGKAERDDVIKEFQKELDDGQYEFFRKPLSLVQIGGRIRDYFTNAREILRVNLLSSDSLETELKHLKPQQLVTLQKFLWDRIFEISANMLGRRIESYYITDRMEPPVNYMRRVGCQEREDYCIANICFGSNPMCAADKIRGELEIMRQIIAEFREEYADRINRGIGQEALGHPSRKKRKSTGKMTTKKSGDDSPPARKTLRKLATTRSR